MIHRSRNCRIAKWIGVMVCVVLVAGWGVSSKRRIHYTQSISTVELNRGVLAFLMTDFTPWGVQGLHTHSIQGNKFPQWPWVARYQYGVWEASSPIWVLLVAAALPAAFLFWRDSRYPPGHCQRCGYDLTGNVTGVCSECGRAV